MPRSPEEVKQLEKFLTRPWWAEGYDPSEGVLFHVLGATILSGIVAAVSYVPTMIVLGAMDTSYDGTSNTWRMSYNLPPLITFFVAMAGFMWYYVYLAHVKYRLPRGTSQIWELSFDTNMIDEWKRPVKKYFSDVVKEYTCFFTDEERTLARPAMIQLFAAASRHEKQIAKHQWLQTMDLLEERRKLQQELDRLKPTEVFVNQTLIRDNIRDLHLQIRHEKKVQELP